MLSDDEIMRLVADMETDRVERKESPAQRDRIAQAVCAYANDLPGHRAPGVVAIGVANDGHPVGLKVTDELLSSVGSLRSDGNILPLPAISVRKVRYAGNDILAIVVTPSADPPVRFEGRVWIRVGPRRAIASRDEERILTERRQAGDLPFDRRPARGAATGDLDLDFFRNVYLPGAVSPDVLAENRRSLEEQLAALRLLAATGEPTNAAILLLGKDPRAWLPGAYIQFARFDGNDLVSPILDQKEIGGRLPDVLRLLDDIAAVNIRIATVVEGHTVEQRRPDYPAAALQQLLRNAAMHRSYEVTAPVYWNWFTDRIEIHSPGGLYGRVTEDNFGQAGVTDYRNPTLAEGLKITGYVQRFGLGIELARRRCAENGNPPPEFEFGPSLVLATMRSAP